MSGDRGGKVSCSSVETGLKFQPKCLAIFREGMRRLKWKICLSGSEQDGLKGKREVPGKLGRRTLFS